MNFKEFEFDFNKYVNEEMARICTSNNYDIRIYTEPLGNPSFHVTYKDEWEVVLQIKDWKILEVKFGDDFKKGEQLSNYIKKDIKEILIKEHKKYKISMWEFLLDEWNINNPEYLIDENMKMPE